MLFFILDCVLCALLEKNMADCHKSRARVSISNYAIKVKRDRPTDQRTDIVAYRVACTLQRIKETSPGEQIDASGVVL